MRARRNDVFIRIFSILLILLLFAGMVGVFVFFTAKKLLKTTN